MPPHPALLLSLLKVSEIFRSSLSQGNILSNFEVKSNQAELMMFLKRRRLLATTLTDQIQVSGPESMRSLPQTSWAHSRHVLNPTFSRLTGFLVSGFCLCIVELTQTSLHLPGFVFMPTSEPSSSLAQGPPQIKTVWPVKRLLGRGFPHP